MVFLMFCQAGIHRKITVLRCRRLRGCRRGLLAGTGRCRVLGARLLITPQQHHAQEVLVRELLGFLLEPFMFPLSITELASQLLLLFPQLCRLLFQVFQLGDRVLANQEGFEVRGISGRARGISGA